MADRKETRHLKVVPAPKATAGSDRDKSKAPVQPNLFPVTSQSLLGIVNMARISAEEFTTVLQSVRPRWVFDLRPLPRFDLGWLNRREVFDLFEKCSISYQDVAGLIGASSHDDARLNPGIISNSLLDLMGNSGSGPLVILLDNDEHISASARDLPKVLKPYPKGGWTVCIYGTREEDWR